MFVWSKSDAIVLPLTLFSIILITVLLWFFLHKKDSRYKKIPLYVITATMLLLELIKQIRAIINGYDNWTIPLHFCSLFLYFFPLAVFTKGKVQEFGKTMSFVCSIWLFILFYFNPGSIIGSSTTQNVFQSFSSIHTFFYHHLAILFLFVSVSLGYYNFTYKNIIYVVIGFVLYAIFGVTMAHLTNTNFCNLLESNIPFMETFRQNVGQVLYTIVMFLIGVVGGCVACLSFIGVNKLVAKFKNKG